MNSTLISIIKDQLYRIIEDIDVGNSDLTEEQCKDVIDYLKEFTDKNKKLSKYQACKYLGVSRATFDN